MPLNKFKGIFIYRIKILIDSNKSFPFHLPIRSAPKKIWFTVRTLEPVKVQRAQKTYFQTKLRSNKRELKIQTQQKILYDKYFF